MKTRLLVLFWVGFCFCGAAQNGLVIPFLNTAPVLDGDLEEWPFAPTAAFSAASQSPSPRNHANIWLGFDETNLYGAFAVQDTRLVQTEYGNGNPRLFLNDAIEVYVDVKNDSHDFMDANDFQLIMDALGQVAVFRGGDKYLLKVNNSQVPKDTMTGSFVLLSRAVRHGTVNNNADTDTGYTLEFQIPWASLGIQPQTGYQFKLDLCLDDLDTLVSFGDFRTPGPIPHMRFQSITGRSDYGFPKNWQTVTLHGQPSGWHHLKNRPFWPFITLSLLLVILPILLWLGFSNRQLRQVPSSAENEPPLEQRFEQEPTPTGALPHQAMFLQAREVVLQHLEQDIPPAELAARLFTGLRQLQRIFKEELQTTPNAFIMAIKMEEAARRLSVGDASVAELAYALGFKDPAYFARVFRKYFGCTPTAFAERKGMRR